MIENALRGLHHALELQGSLGEAELRFQRLEGRDQRRHLLGRGDLRERDDEVRRQLAAQAGEEDVQRAQRPARKLSAERLDADADEWAQRAALQPLGALLRGLRGVPVLLSVGADAVSVLEVDPESL